MRGTERLFKTGWPAFLFLGLMLVLVAGSAQGALVAHYTFDTDSATTCFDVSGNALDGYYLGDAVTSPTSNTLAPGNRCLYVDGDTDGVFVPQRPGVDDVLSTTGVSALQTTMSMAMWVRAFSPNNSWRAIAGRGDAGYTMRLSSRDGNQEMFDFKTNVNRPGGGTDWANSFGYGYQYLGTWHHVVGTFDGNTGLLQFYQNGALTCTNEIEPGATLNINPGALFFMGGESLDNGTFRRYWHGQLDDVRVYDHVLTQAEVDGIYADENQDPRDPTDFVRPARMYVSNAGDDLSDGLTWGTAKATIQGAVDASYDVPTYSIGGAVVYSQTEIWVQSGTYEGDVMVLPFTDLIGGFAGTETTLAERIAIADNPTTITTQTLTAQTHKVEIDDVIGCSIDGFIFTEIPGFGVALSLQRTHGVTVRNCTFVDNDTDSNVQNGRCVFVTWGPDHDGADKDWTVFENCVWDNNLHDRGANGGTAGDPRGAGIYATRWCDVRVSSCTFTNNTAYSWDGAEEDGRGGAIWFNPSTDYRHRDRSDGWQLIVENCLFENNRAGERGGAIFINEDWGSLTVDNCDFINNRAERLSGGTPQNSDGGAIFSDVERSSSITNCLFDGNVSYDDGGAVFFGNSGGDSRNDVIVDNCVFRNNQSDEGGAIRVEANNKETSITNCLFEDNLATDPNDLTASSNGDGGAICVTNNDHKLYIADCDFNRNLGADQGGAIQGNSNHTQVTILRCNFVENSNKIEADDNDSGGACRFDNDRITFLMEDCLFERNESTDWGGAIDFAADCNAGDEAHITIRRTQFLDNVSDSSGAALGFRNDWNNVTIEQCVFTGNTTLANDGGAIDHSVTDGNVAITDCQFTANTAARRGGGMNIGANRHFATITNCDFTDNVAQRGGAIENFLNNNNNPSLTTYTLCTFLRNTAITGDGRGGAIYMRSDMNAQVLRNCDFIENQSSDRGGAIATENWRIDIDAQDCNFLRNVNTGGSGGAIGTQSNLSVMNFERCLFEENFTQSDGGAIRFDNGGNATDFCQPVLRDCIFRRNTTTWGGGAIQQSGMYQKMFLYGCEFTENTSGQLGGAILVRSRNHETTIDDCTFTGNWVDGGGNDGGAIFQQPSDNANDDSSLDSKMTITNSTFTENSSGDTAGAIYWSNSRFMTNIDNCVFDSNSSNWGGALHGGDGWNHNDMATTITNSVFLNNAAVVGRGGAYRYRCESHKIYIANCDFLGNTAGNDGGALGSEEFDSRDLGGGVMAYATLTVNDCLFADNVSDQEGGAIFLNETDSDGWRMIINRCDFINNQSRNEGGGAIGIDNPDSGNLEVNDSRFINNQALNGGGGWGGRGGAINSRDGDRMVFSINRCDFLNNSAPFGHGGAISRHNENDGTGDIIGCLFAGNHAGDYGGGINFRDSDRGVTNLTDCEFYDNSVGPGDAQEGAQIGYVNFGHQIALQTDQSVVTNCVFAGGVSTNQGGVARIYQSDPTFVNCTFSNNRAPNGGGFNCGNNADPVFINCIFDDLDNFAIFEQNDTSDPILTNCLFNNCPQGYVQDNGGTNAITIADVNALPEATYCTEGDPGFLNKPAHLFLLTAASLAIDAGDGLDPTVPAADIFGAARPFDVVAVDNNALDLVDNQIDIGAYEFQGTVVSPVPMVVDPLSMNFGSQLANGGPAAPQFLTIFNTGAAAINVASLTLSMPASYTVLGGAAPLTIDVGGFITLTVTFDPSTVGAHNGTLTIGSDAVGMEVVVIYLFGDATNTPPNAGIVMTFIPENPALILDGDGDYADTNFPCTLLANADMTFEMWLRRADGTEGWFIGDGAGNGDNNTLHIGFRDADTVAFGFWNGDLEHTDAVYGNVYEWHHYAFVYDWDPNNDLDGSDSIKEIWYDGVRVANNVGNIYNAVGSLNLNIGRRETNNGLAFSGVMDNVRLWDYPLTGAEIAANMTADVTGLEAGLLISMDFDADVGQPTSTDDADGATTQAGANDGTLNNQAHIGDPGWLQPIETDLVFDLTEDETTTLALFLLDADGDTPLVGRITQLPALGTLYNWDPGTGRGTAITAAGQLTAGTMLLYVPRNQTASYTDTMTYLAYDGLDDSVTDGMNTFNVTCDNDPVVITANFTNVQQGTTTTIGSTKLAATGDNPISFTIDTLPSRGTLLLNGVSLATTASITQAEIALGVLRYVPDPGVTDGTDSFNITAIDESGDSVAGVMNITIVPDNLPPVLGNHTIVTLTLTPVTLSANELSATDDLDAPADITFTLATAPVLGQLLVSGTPALTFNMQQVLDGLVVYRGGAVPGDDSVQMDVSDSLGGVLADQTLSITVSAKASVKILWTLWE